MQKDMHFYGTYILARAAGFKAKDAHVIAYSSQFVDDSLSNNSQGHKDGGLIYAIATSHHGADVVVGYFQRTVPWLFNLFNPKSKNELNLDNRRVWVPFHFLPGNSGNSISDRLVCRYDSDISAEMMDSNIKHALKNKYGLYLLGISSHVYMDTFAHYGFSGVCSRKNKVNAKTINVSSVKNPEMRDYIITKFNKFIRKYKKEFLNKNWREVLSSGIELATGALGHGAVATYPDRPFLKWSYQYESSDDIVIHDNVMTYMEGCKKLFEYFSDFARQYYGGGSKTNIKFSDIEEIIKGIIIQELPMERRIKEWITVFKNQSIFKLEKNEEINYSGSDWEKQKEQFVDLMKSAEIYNSDIYKFYQAALYHRWYVLKKLLPEHGIVIY